MAVLPVLAALAGGVGAISAFYAFDILGFLFSFLLLAGIALVVILWRLRWST